MCVQSDRVFGLDAEHSSPLSRLSRARGSRRCRGVGTALSGTAKTSTYVQFFYPQTAPKTLGSVHFMSILYLKRPFESFGVRAGEWKRLGGEEGL